MQYVIKAMSLGEILDQAVKLVKSRAGLFLAVAGLFYFPVALLQEGLNAYLTAQVEGSSPEDMAANAGTALTMMYLSIGFLVIFFAIIYPLTNAAIITAVGEEYLGKEVTFKQVTKRALRLLPAMIIAGILVGFFVMLGLIALIIPGIYLMLRFSLVNQVVVLEGLTGMKALKRSWYLMKGNMGTVLVLGFIASIITVVFALVAAILPTAILTVIGTAIGNTVAVVFAATASVVFYFSCRSKVENYDLQLLAESIGEAPPQPAGLHGYQPAGAAPPPPPLPGQ